MKTAVEWNHFDSTRVISISFYKGRIIRYKVAGVGLELTAEADVQYEMISAYICLTCHLECTL